MRCVRQTFPESPSAAADYEIHCTHFLQVAVPVRVAKILTYPERVTDVNIEKMRQAVRNGPDVHPGAVYLISPGAKLKRFLRFGDRNAVADNLKVGEIVERHIVDGE